MGIDVSEWAREAAERGAGQILLTSIDRDGTCLGYDCRLIEIVARIVSVPIIASGGASMLEHFLDGYLSGASALLAAGIFHRGEVSIREIKEFLKAHDVEVRL